MAQPTGNANVCTFTVDHPIYPGASINCKTPQIAEGSPLLEALFAIDGVKQVMLRDNMITIDKASEETWPTLGKQIGAAIRGTLQRAIAEGTDFLSSKLQPDAIHELFTDDAMDDQIRALLDESINPAVASHGGVVELVGVRDNDVYLRMGGGCQGCGAAALTLQMSVERTLRSHLPQIRKIIDTTDHSAGHNPYY